MIDNLQGLASTFDRIVGVECADHVTNAAERLVQADMGAAAAQRHMSTSYHTIVNEAKRWLRGQWPALRWEHVDTLGQEWTEYLA